MNNLQIFKNSEFGEIRTVTVFGRVEMEKEKMDKKEELLHDIISIIEVLPVCECQRIKDYLSELYFS